MTAESCLFHEFLLSVRFCVVLQLEINNLYATTFK